MWIQEFIGLIESLRGHPAAGPIFILIYAGGCFVAPISLFPVAGGVLFGFRAGLALNLFSVLLGASGAFTLARRLGRRRLDRWLDRWRAQHPLIDALENPTPGAFILIRLLGFPPFALTNYLMGLSHMSWRRFLWTSAVGLLPWTLLMTSFANLFWQVLRDAGLTGFRQSLADHIRPLLGLLLALAAAVTLTLVLHRVSRQRGSPPPKN